MLSNPLHYWGWCVGLSALLILWIFFVPKKARAACSLVLRPNWLSVFGAIAALVGFFYFFRNEEYFWAVILLSASGGTDLADGRIARAYTELRRGGKILTKEDGAGFWVRMNHRGATDLGESLDPAMDKARLAPIFIYVCYTFFKKAADVRYDGLLWAMSSVVVLITLMLLVDFAGQAIRSKVFDRWRPKKKKKDKRADWKGKSKALGQWLWLPAWAAWDKGLLPDAENYLILLIITMFGVLLLTVASLLSKMRRLDKLYDEGFPLNLD